MIIVPISELYHLAPRQGVWVDEHDEVPTTVVLGLDADEQGGEVTRRELAPEEARALAAALNFYADEVSR
jgi:hypothetical protein